MMTFNSSSVWNASNLKRLFPAIDDSPALPNLPTVNDARAFEHVVVRVLRGGEARVVGEHADARADVERVEQSVVLHRHLAVLLRERADAQAGLRAFEVEHAAV